MTLSLVMAEKWLKARDVPKIVRDITGVEANAEIVLFRAAQGLIKAKATKFIAEGKTENDYLVPKEFWHILDNDPENSHISLWATGDFYVTRVDGSQASALGVSFYTEDVEEAFGPVDIETPSDNETSRFPDAPPTKTQSNAGRKPAAWWDDLWVEICRQIYSGELSDFTPADIERAMLDWLSTKGHHPSDGTIKPRAAKLAKALKSVD